jgi:hypothetical protein
MTDSTRLPIDQNGGSIPVASHDFDSRIRVDIDADNSFVSTVALSRGLYRIQSVGQPVWMTADAAPADAYMLFPGDDGVHLFDPGTVLTFTTDADVFGAGSTTVTIIPISEV